MNLLICVYCFQPHVVIHCAAERRPDIVDSQPDAATQLNVTASGILAKEAGKNYWFFEK